MSELRDALRGLVSAEHSLNLDDFDEEYLRQASTATCPTCGHFVELHTLVVSGDVWTQRG